MDLKDPLTPLPGALHDVAINPNGNARGTGVRIGVDVEGSGVDVQGASPRAGRDDEETNDSPSAEALLVLRASDPDDPRFETAEDPRIPSGKMYFKIGEVAKITGIKPYVLRYWEVEFPWIRPEKTSSRQRRYRRQDVALLLEISRLRYEEQLTIDRARQVIREERRHEGTSSRERTTKAARAVRRSLAGPSPAEEGVAQLSLGLAGMARSTQLSRALADLRRTVLELLESVEE